MNTRIITALFLILFTLPTIAAEVTVTDDNIQAGDNVTWTADNTYILSEMVFVEEGGTLTIEAGTVVKGNPGQEHDACALVICRDAKLFANGTADNPIIFTAAADDPHDMTDLPLTETGLWGGVILLGKAQINTPGGEGQVEGISEDEPRGKYGAADGEFDNADNSGSVTYVQIRHGGTDIGDGNEINGLTLGAVGSGTTIHHVEVWYNKDDGFEFFGGTVNTKYLVSAFNGDDSFDYDEGFNGKGQFWFSIQATNRGNMAGEHDGATKPEDSQPYATPHIYNATYIGSGVGSENTKSSIIHLRDNAGCYYHNSIFMDATNKGLDVEELASGEDSKARLEAGELQITNNIWWNIGSETTTWETIAPDVPDTEKDGKQIPGYDETFVRDYLADEANHNMITDPMLSGISRTNDAGLDPRPNWGSPAMGAEMADYPDGGFFSEVNYLGAFGKDNWMLGWTMLDAAGYIGNISVEDGTEEETADIFSCYPTPARGNTTVNFTLVKPSEITVTVFNMAGQNIRSFNLGEYGIGSFSSELDLNGINNGSYIVRFETNTGVAYQTIIVE